MDSLVPVLIVLLLLLLNALFVAAEFAIVSAPRTSIERRAAQGDRLARVGARHSESPQRQDRFIATAQLGITIASLGLGMYGEHVLAEWLIHRFEAAGWGGWAAAHTLASVGEHRHPDLLPHRRRRDDPEVAGAAERRADGAVDHACDAGHLHGAVPVRHRAERGRQPAAAAGRHRSPHRVQRAAVLAGGALAHRRGERGGRPAARRGRSDAARAVCVQRHRRRAKPWCRASASAAFTLGADPDEVRVLVEAYPHTRFPVFERRSRSHPRPRPHQGSPPPGRERAARHRRRHPPGAQRARNSHRSTSCSRHCASRRHRWRWSSTSTAARRASSHSRMSSTR